MDDLLNISQERWSHSLTVLTVRGVFLSLRKGAVIISVIFCLPSSHAFFLWKKNYSCPTLSPPGSNGTDHRGYEVKRITQVWPLVYTTPLARMVHSRMTQVSLGLLNEHESWKSEGEMIRDEIIWVTLNSGLTLDSLGSYVNILFCLSSGTWSNQSVCLSQFELGFFYLQPRQPWLTSEGKFNSVNIYWVLTMRKP